MTLYFLLNWISQRLIIYLNFSILICFSTISFAGESSKVKPATQPFKVSAEAGKLLENFCYECHDSEIAKGKIRFDNLTDLSQEQRFDLMNQALEHVFSGEMPPKKEKQPTPTEREQLEKWLRSEIEPYGAVKLDEKLRYYKYANYLNHDKLFSGEIKELPYTKARRWRVNEIIYNERINDVFELKGKARQSQFFGVVKPFNLPLASGVNYYDTEIVEGGQFLTLMSNAKWVVEKQLRAALLKSGFTPNLPEERWNPNDTAEPFKKIIMQSEVPSDEMFANAIKYQFKVALQREPSVEELAKYMSFMKETLKVSDKVSALKKMMVSVLMEPEFLYRNEFGGGEVDDFGRKMLTPREGSYALAYALTDNIPDAALVEAVKSNKLNTKADYEREVRRMLNDNLLEKPRILRFFQDYFGYKGIFNVFKDEQRFVGAYNPHRVVSHIFVYRVPGKVSKEADLLVEWVLAKDQKVLETLLTTDQFFVHHTGDNEDIRKKTAVAQERYAKLRKIYLATVEAKHKDYIKILKDIGLESMVSKGKDGKPDRLGRHFYIDLDYSETIFGKDGTKRGGSDEIFLPELSEGIEHSTKMYNFDHRTWNYVVEQPFKVPNRMGILTHPAWLVSHSHNAATDPIVRGKWVREKLLGGFIRDVPISVDAKVPDDPHRTLRERFIVTEDKKCWQCHEKMNPLGYPFESYDDFGRYRTEEEIEYPVNIIKTEDVLARNEHGVMSIYKVNHYKTKPVNSAGVLEGTGDKALDGAVKDVPDMIQRLAKSDRVRQVFIRNVFRYYMGRNETLADSKTLIEADRVYRESGGSFKELTVSLLTSDSFIYRK